MRKLMSFILTALCSFAFAQSNEVIDRLLAQSPATYGETCYMVLAAGERVPETASIDESLSAAVSRKLIAKKTAGTDPVTLGDYSLLLMKGLGMKGGVMYSLLHSKTYAYRELVYLGVIAAGDPPSRVITGAEVMRYLLKAMEIKGGGK